MDSNNAGSLIQELSQHFKENPPGDLTVDLGNVTYLDDFGTLVLVGVAQTYSQGEWGVQTGEHRQENQGNADVPEF